MKKPRAYFFIALLACAGAAIRPPAFCQEPATTAPSRPDSQDLPARLEERLQESLASAADLRRRQAAVQDQVERWKRRLDEERKAYADLLQLIEKGGRSGRMGQLMRSANQNSQRLLSELEGSFSAELEDALESHRTRQFQIGSIRRNNDQFQNRLETAIQAQPESERADYQARATEARAKLLAALADEENLLVSLIAGEDALQKIWTDLATQAEQTQQFVLPRLFWIRNATPLAPFQPAELKREGLRLVDWARELFHSWGAMVREFSSVWAFLLLALVAVAAPAALFWANRLIQRALKRLEHGRGRLNAIKSTSLSIFRACLFPAYFAMAGFIMRGFNLPARLSDIAAEVFFSLAWGVGAISLVRVLLGGGRILERFLRLPGDIAASLQSIAGSYFVLFFAIGVPARILLQPPFSMEIIPRLAFCLLGLLGLGPLSLFLRKGGPLCNRVAGKPPAGFVGRNWSVLRNLLLAAFSGCIALDFFGYRSAGTAIAIRLGATTTTALILFSLHGHISRGLLRLVGWILRKPSPPADEPPAVPVDPVVQGAAGTPGAPGSPPAAASIAAQTLDRAARDRTVLRLVRGGLFIAGVLICAWYWGLDENVLRSLRSVAVYRISETEIVSLSDILTTAVTILATVWLLRNLPGIYEVTLFPRVNFDTGLRYATLTISRYGILFLGVIISLSSIHLGLERLSWLMAAVGFGLGFGLQEIFSNFVSGIILLVERPVRVGDIVRTGDVIGSVARINIRATTVLDADRCEVIIPNKEFITGRVTNWTLNDTITRLVIPVGVAYGTAVQEVVDLLLELAHAQPEILKDPAPSAFLVKHGSSSLDFELRFFVPEPALRTPLQSRLNTIIYEELGKRGIEVPYPTHDIHIKSSPEAAQPERRAARDKPGKDG